MRPQLSLGNLPAPLLMPRRLFLRWSLGALAALVSACTGGKTDNDGQLTPQTRRAKSSIAKGVPGPFEVNIEGGQPVEAVEGPGITLVWTKAERAKEYDVELNGVLVTEGLVDQRLPVRGGDHELGFQNGRNSLRVRARNRSGESWSREASFEVATKGYFRNRSFDHEDDGEVRLAAPSRGSALIVGPRFAYGGNGKGTALRCYDRGDTSAFIRHSHLPVGECWLRLAVRIQSWEHEDVPISLATIRSQGAKANEQIIWQTGRGVRSTSIADVVPASAEGWLQLQLGVLADGSAQLWAFNGQREFLVGRGANSSLAKRGKDVVLLGNDSPNGGITYEVWLDELAVGERRLPWAKVNADATLRRPTRIDAEALPPVFSFVFGSDIDLSLAPYRGTAIEAMAALEPDFVLNLGDFGYPDTEAYKQSKGGYLATWSDLVHEERLNRLFKKPWIYITSDHDLGRDDADASTLLPFASEAFATWQNNDRSADGVGRYGSLELDDGRILLVWTDTITFRSPIRQPDGPNKTILGPEQKRWLLNLLNNASASLIIIASQTSFGHRLPSGWFDYLTERREIYRACRGAKGLVRWLSGDHHGARWARMGPKIAEWGAAPLAAYPHGRLAPAEFVDKAVSIRPEFQPGDSPFVGSGLEKLKRSTSFGRVVIDTQAKTATFEVRDNQGRIKSDDSGFRLEETITYG